jgi:hypothetical protein
MTSKIIGLKHLQKYTCPKRLLADSRHSLNLRERSLATPTQEPHGF